MNWIKRLFCAHSSKVLSEKEETYTAEVLETTYSGHKTTARTFWGEPIMTTRKTKTVLLECTKCGKIYKEVL